MGEYPDPDLEVSLIQQRERFKRNLARIDILDISEISCLGAVARMQAKTCTAMVRREQHKRFHDWVLSASNPLAPRGNGIGKLHRHVNSPNVARSLCQVSTEKGVLRSTPSAFMEVREAAWANRWLRDTAASESLVAELVSLRALAIAEDVPLLDPVTVHKLDQTLRRIPDNTGLGCDCVEPGAIKHAPVDAKQELCHVLDCIIRTGVLPLGSPVCDHCSASQRRCCVGKVSDQLGCFRFLCESWTACSMTSSLLGVTLPWFLGPCHCQ